MATTTQTIDSDSAVAVEIEQTIAADTLVDDGIVDEETGSVWNTLGKAISGPMAGTELEPVIHQNHFWFAWAVFEPDTEIRDSEDDIAGPVSLAS